MGEGRVSFMFSCVTDILFGDGSWWGGGAPGVVVVVCFINVIGDCSSSLVAFINGC